MNHVNVVGRFVKPIVVKEIGSDKCVINNIIAIAKKRKTTEQSQADFIPVVMWGKVARIVEKYCEKGNLIGLSGRLVSRQYLSTDGKQNFVVEIQAEEVHLVEGKRYLE